MEARRLTDGSEELKIGRGPTVAAALAAGIVILIALRLESFTEPFLEFDEGIYLLMAREVAHGHLPYLTLFDAKPPVFFFMLGAAVRAFGTSILVLRAIALVAVLASCAAIYRICDAFVSDRKTIAFLAIAAYAGMTSTTQGLAANAELILTPFVLWAFAPIVRAAASRSRLEPGAALASGVLLGVAIELKLTAAGEALFGVAFAAFATTAAAGSFAALIAGIVAPTAIVLAVYAANGATGAFVDANVVALGRRIGHAPHDHTATLRTIAQQLRAFSPASLFVFATPFALPTASPRERRLMGWLVAWLIFDVFQVFAEGELYPHQFLNAMAPAAIVGAWAAVHALRRFAPQQTIPPIVAALALVAVAVHALPNDVRAIHQMHGERLDQRDAMARYLSEHLGSRTLFVVDEQSLFYALTGTPLPSRFATLFSSAALVRLAGVDGAGEIDRIFATKPDVVLHSTDPEFASDEGDAIRSAIARHLEADYVQTYCSRTSCLYERRVR